MIIIFLLEQQIYLLVLDKIEALSYISVLNSRTHCKGVRRLIESERKKMPVNMNAYIY